MSTTSGGPNIVINGLVLHLDAANTKSYPGSGITWLDLSGNNNNGYLSNGPTFSSANGGSIVFDGTNDYIYMGGSSIQLSNNFTLSVWHKPNVINTLNAYIIDQGNIGQNPTNSLQWHNYGLTLTAINISSVSANGTINTANWNNMVCSFTSGTVKFYINGILDSTITATFTSFTPNGDLKIARQGHKNRFFSGNIANVYIYYKVLSDSEVLQNYNSQKSRFGLS